MLKIQAPSRFIRFVFILAAVWLIPATVPLAADETDGWHGSAALATGVYNPDQEPRLLGDTVGGAFIFGGFGFHTPWQGKEFANIPLALRFDTGRLRLGLNYDRLGIRPGYFGHVSLRDFDYEGKDASLSQVRSIQFDPITRETATARAALRLNEDASKRRFHLILGARRLHVRYDFSGQIVNNIDISQSFISSGTTFTWSGNVSEIENVYGSSIDYRARGGLWGLSYSEDLTDELELRVQAGFYNLSGTARSRRQSLSIQSGTATLRASTGASSSASEDEIFYNLRTEDARLFVNGNEFELGLFYKVGKDLKVFTRLHSAASQVKDSEVALFLFTTNKDANPYTNTINGEQVYSLTARFTYPGSTAPESVGSLAFGIEKKF